MGPLGIRQDRIAPFVRAALLVAGLSTYLVSPDDVVWHFIKDAPHARVLEHALFGTAAAVLGVALLLRMKASAKQHRSGGASDNRAAVAGLLQAIGIGSLMPLPGFLLLVFGELGVSILLHRRHPAPEDFDSRPAYQPADKARQAFRWRDALVRHMGLCCAFISMLIFSIVLIDRVADVLFAATALVSIAVSSRQALRR